MKTIFAVICMLALQLLSPVILKAQKNSKGYYLTQTGDSISGTVNYKQWEINPDQVSFYTSDNRTIQLTPSNAKQFTVQDQDTYMARRIQRMLNPVVLISDINALDSSNQFETKDVFLRLLAQTGNYRLLGYRDQKRENYFIENKQTLQLTELTNRLYKVPNEYQTVASSNYRMQLYSFFQDMESTHPSIKRKIEKLKYKENDLIKFFESLSDQPQAKNKSRKSSELTLSVGVANNTFKVVDNSPNDFSGGSCSNCTDYKSQVSPVLAITYTSSLSRNLGRNYFSFQLKYYNFKHHGVIHALTTTNNVTYKASNVGLGILLGKNIIRNSLLTWYASLGMTFSLLIGNEEINSYPKATYPGNNFAFNLPVITGVKLKGGLGVWANYDILNTKTHNFNRYSPVHRSVQGGVSYSFKL